MIEDLLEADPVVVFFNSRLPDDGTAWMTAMLDNLAIRYQPFDLGPHPDLQDRLMFLVAADRLPLLFIDAQLIGNTPEVKEMMTTTTFAEILVAYDIRYDRAAAVRYGMP